MKYYFGRVLWTFCEIYLYVTVPVTNSPAGSSFGCVALARPRYYKQPHKLWR